MARPVDTDPMFKALARGDVQEARAHARMVRSAGRRVTTHATPSPAPRSTMTVPPPGGADLVSALRPVALLDEVSLPPNLRRDVEQLVREHRSVPKLARHGLDARRRVLLLGAPGLGKSMTAGAIAAALDWPIFLVRMDALVRSYLGQSATQIRELFRLVRETPAVFLLDELDAIGRRRGHLSDVGEIDRVVVTLLQELEHSLPAGLLVATSNMEANLDPALLRRFDLVLQFPKPSTAQLRRFATAELARRGLPARTLAGVLAGARSFADIARAVADEHRRFVLGK